MFAIINNVLCNVDVDTISIKTMYLYKYSSSFLVYILYLDIFRVTLFIIVISSLFRIDNGPVVLCYSFTECIEYYY